MITKGLFIKLEKLNCSNIDVLRIFNDMMEDSICYIINKVITYNSADNLNICYKYDRQKVIDGFVRINNVYYSRLITNLLSDLENVTYLIEKNINEAICEFIIYSKDKPNLVLNINSVLLNKDMLVINAEVLERGVLC